MNQPMGRRSIEERAEYLFNVISSQHFLRMENLNGELPFFICDYRADEAVEMARMQRRLVNRLDQSGVNVLDLNLYDLSIDLLQRRDGTADDTVWSEILAHENEWEKDSLLELLQNVLDPEEHLVPEIATHIRQTPHDVLFLSGVGDVFPYLRSHNVLNNLQSTAKDKPTVMFFPGGYTHSVEFGASLDLFNRLHDDKYYRAYNIFSTPV